MHDALRSASDRITTLRIDGLEIPWHDLEETSSTMDYAAKLAKSGCGWMVVSARNQISGRGTQGRMWNTFPDKGIWVSIIMPSPMQSDALNGLTLTAAEVLSSVLEDHTHLKYTIKPPNDITIRGKKLAGILIESVSRGLEIVSVILGMGLNISQDAEDFTRVGLPEATSVFIETGMILDRKELLESFLRKFRQIYEAHHDRSV